MPLPAGGARAGGRTRTSRREQRETYFPDVERPKHRLPCSSFLLHLPSKPQNPGRSKQPTMLRRKDIAQERLSGRRGWAPFKSMFRICLCLQVCVRGTCSVLGRDCPYSWFRPLVDFSIGLSCANLTNTDLKVGFFILRNYFVDTFQNPSNMSCCILQVVGDDSTPLPQADLPLPSLSSSSSPYCCTNSSSSATFLQVLGTSCFSSWREVTDFRKLCNWSPWVNGTCKVS